MTDTAPGGTSSTPTAATPVVAATAATPVTAQPAQASTPAIAATPATTPTASDTSTTAATPTEPVATPDPAPVAAFTLPEDLKIDPKSVEKFDGFIKAKTPVDGKITVTAQEIVDIYADQARDAYQRWQEQITAQDKTWESESKARFTPKQLAAAETGVGFLSSFEPAFRELSKGFRNNPSFVNAMRVVGERLSEDTFEIAGNAPPTKTRRTSLYGN